MRLITLVLVVAVGAGCSINHRSGEFACTLTSDCNSGRECIDGFCVVPGTTPMDAPKPPPTDAPKPPPMDAPACPSQCTTCDVAAMTCTINCETSDCTGKVTCPPGYTCTIECTADGSCHMGIDCTQSKGCNIQCAAHDACDTITCGTGPCEVSCGGRSSCLNVDCSNSCKCDVACIGLQSCEGAIECQAPECVAGTGLGCSSTMLAECNTCP